MNKKSRIIATILIMLLILACVPAIAFGTATVGQAKVKTVTAGYKAVKVSWGKVKGADGYEIYRGKGRKGKLKLVKTMTKGSKTVFLNKKLKKNSIYYYKVRAYDIQKGKKVYGKFSDKTVGSSGIYYKIKNIYIDEKSPTCLSVRWHTMAEPKCFVIYRADKKAGKYKKIATVKKGKAYAHRISYDANEYYDYYYYDNDVRAGKTYYYKVKAYKKYNKTYIKGKTSKAAKGCAVYGTPHGVGKAVTSYNTNTDRLVFKMTTPKYGYPVIIQLKSTDKGIQYREESSIKDVTESMYVKMILEACSRDGKTYIINDGGKITVKPGETIFFRAKCKTRFDFTGRGKIYMECRYNGKKYPLNDDYELKFKI